MTFPPHPRLLATEPEIAALRDKAVRCAWVAEGLAELLAAAGAWLDQPVEFPPRGGEWGHWYADPATGEALETVSPTEHRNPRTGRVFRGWPYDDVVIGRRHARLAAALRDLAFAALYTGEPAYAARAKEVLLGYAARYRRYPIHFIRDRAKFGCGRIGPQALDESTWLIPVCQGADLLWGGLSDSERTLVTDGLLRPGAATIRRNRMPIHNIQCWKNSAVGLVGLLLGDEELVADAVDSEHGFREQVTRGVNADGQWYEGAWHYHFYTMHALLPLLEAGRRCGLHLYGFEGDGRGARRLFEAPLEMSMPDRRLPAFSDSPASDVNAHPALYEVGLARYGDARFAAVLRSRRGAGIPALLAGLERLPEPPTERPRSRDFAGAGYAVLRAGTGDRQSWLCLKYGPHGSGHGHPDKLSFVFWSRGRIVALDPGCAPYGVPLHFEWCRSTLGHNTLCVDGADQARATGRLLGFRSDAGDNISAAWAEAGAIYPGVSFRRAVVLCGPDLLLLHDQVTSDLEHTYELAWHGTGTWREPPSGAAVALPEAPPYRYLAMVRTAGDLPLATAGDLDVALSIAAPGAEVWAGTGVEADAVVRLPCVIVHRRARSQRVAWAVALGGGRAQVALTDDGLRAELDGRRYVLRLAPGGVRVEAQGAARGLSIVG